MSSGTRADSAAMREALRLAALGVGRTAPNPAVGCIVTNRAGEVVGRGYHARAGEPHAEVGALDEAGSASRGGTLYVTLEPCCHFGKTGPCTEAIISAGITRVVAAMVDPDPRVGGKGLSRLREHGILVSTGPGSVAASRMNEGYLKVRRCGMPFVVIKMAMSLDGKIATAAGESKWITSAAARGCVQAMRDASDAVMVGIGTVLADDPSLTVRPAELPPGYPRLPRSPTRIVLDSLCRTPSEARVLNQPGRCIILTTRHASPGNKERLLEAGGAVIVVEGNDKRVNLQAGMIALAENGLHSILMEGGAEAAAAMLEAKAVDRLLFFVAPKIIGGSRAPGPVGGPGRTALADALITGKITVRRYPPDVAMEVDIAGY